MTAVSSQSTPTSTSPRGTSRAKGLRALAVAASFGVAGVVLAGCTPDEPPSNVPGTTPSVVTGNQAPPGGVDNADGINQSPDGAGLKAKIVDASGAEVGTATFTQAGTGVKVVVNVAKGVEPGFHGVHIHQNGVCEGSGTEPFTSAGGHLQVDGNTGHPSSGDLVSINVLENGTGQTVTTTGAVTLDQIKGKSIVIHEKADNFANIPTRYAPAPDQDTLKTGDAGKRVACGVIEGGE